jgi:hypothetical protein
MKMAVFWTVAPCSLVEVYQRFTGPCCLHHQGDETRLHGATAATAPSSLKLLFVYLNSKILFGCLVGRDESC